MLYTHKVVFDKEVCGFIAKSESCRFPILPSARSYAKAIAKKFGFHNVRIEVLK